ncbi:uncharacterized protein CHSO_1152 [Chryseobacterium sp. StRB126]|uniref:T9SS type A sorting domain-containing protein n=1 Tax=Chryseobacterium sp. StRB126 TaxID=878220 RepID=UPI0004E993CA|nr:T9SS type A sorting domain-containing protein [Chryseobacterium sp. StRB126]BAP30189.1 uncharacterized protein CHSO_1152 [Chryseobacterium sp. StRB126]
MKIYVLAVCILRKAMLLPLLMFIASTLVYAQQVYVSSQSSQIYGVCFACSVQDPENAIGSDESNYAFMRIPLGAFASIEQTLIFPSVKTYSKVVIGIGTNQAGLSVQLLGGVSVETFNGNVSNNDYRIVNNEILKIGATDPSKGTIEFTTNKPYDRIVLRFTSGVGLNGGLQIYYTYQLDKVYASSETRIIKCPGCSVQNPQNAVGPNENDFSKLIAPSSGSFYSVEQALHFPNEKTFTKLVIGVGSDSKPIDQVIDKEVKINTNITGEVLVELIMGRLKKDPQDPYKGVIEFITSYPYDQVVLNLSVSPNSARDLKIHYAYQENVYQPVTVASANAMKTVPIEKVLTVFPNPTTGSVTLQGNVDFTDADIFINNTLGKEVFRSKFRSKTIDLPATLPGGIYMLSVQTKDREIYTHKIILTR